MLLNNSAVRKQLRQNLFMTFSASLPDMETGRFVVLKKALAILQRMVKLC